MSSSKVFKGEAGFQPEQLVRRSTASTADWRSTPVSTQPDQPGQTAGTFSRQVIRDAGPRPLVPKDGISAPGNQQTAAGRPPTTTSADEEPLKKDAERNDSDAIAVDVDQIRHQAFQDGVQEGLQRASVQAESDFRSALAALHQACTQIDSVRDTILKNSKDEIIDLIFLVSEKIIRHSLRGQNDTICATVEEALHQAVRANDCVIYLHPNDVSIVKERVPDFIASLNGLDHVRVKSDESVDQGGCRIESETCTVDATIASQLEILENQAKEKS